MWKGAHVGIKRWIEFADIKAKKAFSDEEFRVER